ncbi:hypothetical protein DFH08DRAFT_1075380 [Mycena albidolilacea]|uniref:HNH nuclease domain-containing protein n=1 Tax=Mycena albidolilacea TaxID=1033008 RepID=A0AAD7AGZ2_9AGAR|nr:hypothetical protein DFH08DRAFT_1075380 [Mycena albidolilacea]
MTDVQEPLYRFFLTSELRNLYLDVPVAGAWPSPPAKYLRYLRYCIVGVDGVITRYLSLDGENQKSEQIDDTNPLSAGTYYFVNNKNEHSIAAGEAPTLVHALSLLTNARENIRSAIAARDVSCIFTNYSKSMSQCTHTFPFSRGHAWLRQLLDSRISDPENEDTTTNLTYLNDTRNGMLVANTLHPIIDQKRLVVMKTPTRVLQTTDIPPQSNPKPNTKLFGDVRYSENPRYTLQSKIDSEIPKPSGVLLDYNYGVAALKWWGKAYGQGDFLQHRRHSGPRATIATSNPSRSSDHRSCTTDAKLEDVARTKLAAALEDDFDSGNQEEAETVDTGSEAPPQSQAEELVFALPELG